MSESYMFATCFNDKLTCCVLVLDVQQLTTLSVYNCFGVRKKFGAQNELASQV